PRSGAPADFPLGRDELPELISQELPRPLGVPVEIDSVAPVKAGARELPEQRAEAVVKVELVRASEHHQPVDPFELRDRRRSLGALRGAVEARPKPGLRLERPEGGDERADRQRAEEEHVDPHEERSPARDRDHDREQDRRREGDACPDSDHSALHAASAASTAARSACSLSIAPIAAAFMSASISCGLKRARSNSVVSRLAARRPPVSSPSTRPRYSCGASNRRRGTPCAASERS